MERDVVIHPTKKKSSVSRVRAHLKRAPCEYNVKIKAMRQRTGPRQKHEQTTETNSTHSQREHEQQKPDTTKKQEKARRQRLQQYPPPQAEKKCAGTLTAT